MKLIQFVWTVERDALRNRILVSDSFEFWSHFIRKNEQISRTFTKFCNFKSLRSSSISQLKLQGKLRNSPSELSTHMKNITSKSLIFFSNGWCSMIGSNRRVLAEEKWTTNEFVTQKYASISGGLAFNGALEPEYFGGLPKFDCFYSCTCGPCGTP